MTNFEKYKDDLKELTMGGGVIAVVNGELANCEKTNCEKCDFTQVGNCHFSRMQWVAAEAEPTMTAEEAWNLRHYVGHELSAKEAEQIIGIRSVKELMELTPYEVKAKIEAFAQAKKESKVGDVLQHKNTKCRCVVTNKGNWGRTVMWFDGDFGEYDIEEIEEMFEKTGEHIKIEKVFSKIKGE